MCEKRDERTHEKDKGRKKEKKRRRDKVREEKKRERKNTILKVAFTNYFAAL